VYYKVYRIRGEKEAKRMFAEFKKRPISINHEISDELFEEAGRLKATYKISIADSIALAQASVLDAEFLTSDHHEFDAVEKSERIQFHWIR
jgi:predicted nucleic acid-binding protein